MVRSFLAALLLLSSASAKTEPVAGAQQAAAEERWTRSETRITSRLAGVGFPVAAGAIRLRGTRDFSNADKGTDSGIQYSSADGEVIGTVYVYLPGLAHPGVTAFATEEVMGARSTTPLRRVRSSAVRVGDVSQGAIRNDYENYRGLFSSAAFFKVGRWMIKLRVSGPDNRRQEVEAAMDALLQGSRIGAKNQVLAANELDVRECPAGEGAEDAKLLPDPSGAEIASHGFLATFDAGGHVATNESGSRTDLPSRIPRELCRTRIRIGEGQLSILRSADGPARSVDGRTRLLATLSDSGKAVEVVHARNLGRFVMLYHDIGSTMVLGGYDGVPSDRQIAELLTKPGGEAGRIRVPVILKPDGVEMHLPALAPAAPKGTPQA